MTLPYRKFFALSKSPNFYVLFLCVALACIELEIRCHNFHNSNIDCTLAALNVLLISVLLVCMKLEICCHNFHNSYKIQRYLTENPSHSANLNTLLVSVALKCIELRICCHNIHKSDNFVFIELKRLLEAFRKLIKQIGLYFHPSDKIHKSSFCQLKCSSHQCLFSLYGISKVS